MVFFFYQKTNEELLSLGLVNSPSCCMDIPMDIPWISAPHFGDPKKGIGYYRYMIYD